MQRHFERSRSGSEKALGKQNSAARPTLPDGIDPRHFDSSGGELRGFIPLAVLGALLLAALLGTFGGTSDPQVTAEGDGARLAVEAPQTLRSGMILEIDIVVDAKRPIAKPVVAMSGSYLRNLSFNSIIPAASEAKFDNGTVRLTFDALKAGDRLQVKLDGQVNPALLGENAGTVAILDDKTVLAARPVRLRVFP